MPLHLIPEHAIQQYGLQDKAKNGYIYMEIRKVIYGLPQAGILANKFLKERLAKSGYFEVPHTPRPLEACHKTSVIYSGGG